METLLKVSFTFHPEAQETVIAALLDRGITSFVEGVGDACAENHFLGGITYYLPFEPNSTASTIAAEIAELGEFIRSRIHLGRHPDTLSWSTETSNSRDWSSEWKKFWKPIEVSETLCVVPAWEPWRDRPGQHTIRIETTNAFGTGNHETTRLCLLLLERYIAERKPQTVLDIGCGSGVLSIAAAKLGAPHVCGIDADPIAVSTAEANAKHNNAAQIKFEHRSAAAATGKHDLVVANLLLPILEENAAEIVSQVAAGGVLILSGILTGDAARVVEVFGMPLLEMLEEGEWLALALQSGRPSQR